MRTLLTTLAAAAVLAGCPDADSPATPDAALADAVSDAGIADGISDAAVTPDEGGTEDVAPEVTPPPPPDPEWFQHDDGAAVGALTYNQTPDAYYEFTRFEFEEPVRLLALEAYIQTSSVTTVTLFIWDDFGGNLLSFDRDTPLASVSRQVTPEDSGSPLMFELPEPVDLVPGRMVFAGMVVDGPLSPQLMVDAAPADVGEDRPSASVIFLSNEPPDEQGFPAYAGANGDFMLRLQAQRINVVPEDQRDFEAIDAETLGIPGLSRAAVADVDGDGFDDIMTSGLKLYLNDGDGTFTDATATWLVDISGSNGGVFGDFDNDGDPDYFATGGVDKLLRNDGPGIGFVDVTAASGINDMQFFNCNGDEGDQNVPTEAAAVMDLDNDGLLDIWQGNFICWDPPAWPSKDIVWKNNGDMTFTDVTDAVGAAAGQPQASRGIAPADHNDDGFVDVLVTNYRLNPNLHFENTGDGNLTNVGFVSTLAGVFGGNGAYGHSIGAAWGDIDHDGDLDLFVANLAHPRFITFSQKATLYLNPGGPGAAFEDVTSIAGIRYLETPSNPNFFDYDNDGDLDLFFSCVYPHRTSQLYRNDGFLLWSEQSYASGLRVYDGWGSVVGDFDRDGDLDIVNKLGQYHRNRNVAGRGAVFVKPVGGGAGMTNRDGIGARVTATVDSRLVMRERFGAHGTGVQDSPWLHVGLGSETSVDLTVTFPATGTSVTVRGAQAGDYWLVNEDGATTLLP